MSGSLRQSIASVVVIVSASPIPFAAISAPSATLAVSRARRSIMLTFSLGFGTPGAVGRYLLAVQLGHGAANIAGGGGLGPAPCRNQRPCAKSSRRRAWEPPAPAPAWAMEQFVLPQSHGGPRQNREGDGASEPSKIPGGHHIYVPDGLSIQFPITDPSPLSEPKRQNAPESPCPSFVHCLVSPRKSEEMHAF